ncbi:MAG: prepilin-type N-terminal cleavage/methylation domain-containing protein [Labilithrix sp.]|nr:prepilin-type N-terminal cleavage/methylation domain-containing protein [Labilithrix sp.]
MSARVLSARRRARRGFSLLEVMVAIAILGLTLTVILSAQGGLAASNRSAANMGQAAQLGRCKMTEIEEELLKLGYQEIDQIETSKPCCLDATPEAFTCDYKIEKVELPNMNTGNAVGADGGAGFGAGVPMLQQNAAGGAGLDLNLDGGLQGLGASLMGQMPGAGPGGSGAEGLLGMVMSFLYPSIKPMYEASIRRITVTVRWKEGPNERELPITQFVTNPQRGGFAGSALMGDGGAMDFSGGAGIPGTGTGTPGAGGAGTGTGGGATGGGFGGGGGLRP